jgi:hypothetical protein
MTATRTPARTKPLSRTTTPPVHTNCQSKRRLVIHEVIKIITVINA